MVELARWDTEHFGLKVGNLLWEGEVEGKKLKEEVARSKEEGYQLLYLKGVELPESALSEDILLADEKVVYVTEVTGRPTDGAEGKADEHVVSMLHHDLTDELLALALESGQYSRYHTDPRFPAEAFRTLYRLWMVNSLNGTIATDVLAYMEGGVPIGIITYRKEADTVTIGLVATDSAQANRGIGSRLMQAFLTRFGEGTTIRVATQKRNRIACHFYEKNGFAVESVTNIYHIWN